MCCEATLPQRRLRIAARLPSLTTRTALLWATWELTLLLIRIHLLTHLMLLLSARSTVAALLFLTLLRLRAALAKVWETHVVDVENSSTGGRCK